MKDRKKVLYGKIRDFLKKIFHELAQQKGCEIIGGHQVQDHVHMILSIPPKYASIRDDRLSQGKECYSCSKAIWWAYT